MLYKKLYDHQKTAVDFALKVKTAAIFGKQRTGKTWITMSVIEHLMCDTYEGLIIPPLNNIETTWQKHLTEHLPAISIYRSWDDYKKATAPKIFLVHYEGLSKVLKQILKHKTWKHIIYDESHSLKDRGSLQSRTARKLRHKAEYKLILSGTPIDKRPQEIWAQFRFLNPNILGDRWQDFDYEYLTPTGYMGYQRKFKEHKMEKFLALINPYSIHIEKAVLGSPERQINKIFVPILGEQRQYYQQMEHESVLWYKDERVMATNALTQRVRLQQICGGFIPIEDKTDEKAPPNIHEISNAKLRKLKSIVKKIEPPFVVFCKYTYELYMVYDALVDIFNRVELYHGKMPVKNKPILQEQFQAGLIDVLICQNKAASLGIDLYRASTAIIYSLTFSYIDFDQLMARLDLIEKKVPVQIIILIAQNTIDEDIYTIVTNKENVSDKLLRKLRKQRRQKHDQKKSCKKETGRAGQHQKRRSAEKSHKKESSRKKERNNRTGRGSEKS